MDRHTSASRARPGPDGRRGAALMIAIIVLTALMLLAIPFAAFMRRQHAGSTQALHITRAQSGEVGALSHAQAALGLGQPGAESTANPFPYNNPNVDTLWEFRVTLRTQVAGGGFGTGTVSFSVDDALGLPNDGDPETVDGYIRVDDEWMAYSELTGLTPASTSGALHVDANRRGLFGTAEVAHPAGAIVSFFPNAELWSLDVEDPQSRININTASYRVIRNLLGYLGIGDDDLTDGIPAPAPGDATFPNTRQQDIARAIVEYRTKHLQWLDISDGTDDTPDYVNNYTPFQNLDMLKSISLAQDETTGAFVFGPANPPLSAAEMDLLRPHVTVSSGYATGGGPWLPVGSLETDMTAAAGNLFVANLSDASRVGVGSTVWFRWTDSGSGTDLSEFRTVLAKNGWGRPLQLVADCTALDTSIDLQWAPGFVGASASTPCYIKIDDEWIEYTGVTVDDDADPTTLTLAVPAAGRGQFGSNAAAHLRGMADVDGDVIVFDFAGAAPPDPPPLIGALSADCLVADAPIIRIQNRHGINVNTCTDPVVLESIFYDIDHYGADPFGAPPDTANYVADQLINYTRGGDDDSFNGDEDWFDATDGPMPLTPSTPPWHTARDELEDFFLNLGAPLSAVQEGMLAHNLDALTMPLQFNSGALLGLDSVAVADDRAGTPVAQAPNAARLARLFDVVPPLTESLWQWRSQKEFHEHILATGSSKNVLTMPLNEGLLPPDQATDPADYAIYADTRVDTGTVTAALQELSPTLFTTMLEGLHESPPWPASLNPFVLDYSVAADSAVVAAPADFGNTTAEGITGQHLQYNTDQTNVAGQRHVEANSFLGTIQPFAIELWVKPDTGMATEQFLVDIGAGDPAETAQNQVRLYMNPETTDGVTKPRLVLRLDDQAGTGYVRAWSSNAFDFEPGVWHHVAVSAVGTFRHEIAMFIDGIYDRDMDWRYYYTGGPPTGVESDSINEGYFWPVAMNVPVRKYTVAPGPDTGGWDPGNTEIGLTDIADLPPAGWVVIAGIAQRYEYNGFGTFGGNPTLMLLNPLSARHDAGEPVACMIPVVRPATHKPADDPESVPAGGDAVGFWACTDLGNGVFRADPADLGSSASVAAVMPNPAGGPPMTNFPDYYDWLVFDPYVPTATDPIVAGVPGNILDVQQDRWKAFRYDSFVGAPAAVLAGLLPSGAGTTIHVGADAAGLNQFAGEIDELRVTALPSTNLQRAAAGSWPAGAVNLPLLGWHYFLHAVRGYSAEEQIPPDPSLVRSATAPVHPSGGFFVVCDTPTITTTPILYSYQTYGGASLSTIDQREDDLTPLAPPTSGTAQLHRELRPVMPLNFIAGTSLAAAYNIGSDNIQVVDASQFPPEGYVRIDDEIIGYSGRDTSGAPHLLLRPATAGGPSVWPRGAYGTTEADHLAGAVVRLLPVRQPDRYRGEATAGTWDVHTTYSQAQLDGQMCMVSFPIYRAGKLKKVSWEFKNPLEDGQKVAVLVLVDDAVAWNTAPEGDAAIGPQETDGLDATSNDLLWGTIINDGDPAAGSLDIYHVVGGVPQYPTATSKVEVRFYFDLGGTHPYRYSYTGGVPTADGWQNMIEIDRVQIEMEAESGSY